MEQNSFIEVKALDAKIVIKIKDSYNQLVQKPKKDLDRILDKNFLAKRLIKPMHKFTKSITETSSKV